VLYKTEKLYDHDGLQKETIQLNKLNLSQGTYFAEVFNNGILEINKFIKK